MERCRYRWLRPRINFDWWRFNAMTTYRFFVCPPAMTLSALPIKLIAIFILKVPRMLLNHTPIPCCERINVWCNCFLQVLSGVSVRCGCESHSHNTRRHYLYWSTGRAAEKELMTQTIIVWMPKRNETKKDIFWALLCSFDESIASNVCKTWKLVSKLKIAVFFWLLLKLNNSFLSLAWSLA